jgi:glycerol-3-phosphate dehydrogenase
MIHRDPDGAARGPYDLIVVGGGVYGIMTALEATRRGLRPVLLERAEFAAATSANSLRILHGGLRYLQSLDLPRSLESIRERAWWLRTFPDHVLPLACLMPLYGDGLRRPRALRLVLGLNDLLGRFGGDDLVPPGRVIDAPAVREIFPAVDPHGLKGGAVWYDAFAPDMPRLLLEVLRWACAEGAVALAQVEAVGLLMEGGRAAGVRAKDLKSGAELHLRAPEVINTTGPWAASFAAACGGHAPGLFVPTLAWNIAFRRPALADHALAVAPRRKGAQTFFLVPWQKALLAGTGHALWRDGPEQVRVPEPVLDAFIADLNDAVPGVGLKRDEILRVFAGLLPGQRAEAAVLARRPMIVDHGTSGGPAGLYSVRGVKLTTARAVAARALGHAFPSATTRPAANFGRPRLVAGASDPSRF